MKFGLDYLHADVIKIIIDTLYKVSMEVGTSSNVSFIPESEPLATSRWVSIIIPHGRLIGYMDEMWIAVDVTERDGIINIHVGAVSDVLPGNRNVVTIQEFLTPYLDIPNVMSPYLKIVETIEAKRETRKSVIECFHEDSRSYDVINKLNKLGMPSEINFVDDLGIQESEYKFAVMVSEYLRARGYDTDRTGSSNWCNERLFIKPTMDLVDESILYKRAKAEIAQ